ncbi:accessory Sec system translocase SecA2 [Dactylosporangium sp. NPDC005555]|uniref:accessory Sec system translocase SecA2 n=1 Tax=Dactylosporangium sp. NPDC005555 TaxID=3154889 RepID=UPI0033B04780
MGLVSKFNAWRRKLQEQPGTTIDLEPMQALLPLIEEREAELSELTDDELRAAATALHQRDDPQDFVEACALGREAAKRALDERPYDVQLLGAQVLLAGHVVEMATGEGKTLTAAIAAAGYAAMGPVHVITVNDYLARRDAEWMRPVYALLDLTVGWVNESSTPDERREAYACDITYVSVSEAGFDLLRDSIVTDTALRVHREFGTVIIDEADSILIDEAKVPLVLAGSTIDEKDSPVAIAEIAGGLRRDHDYDVVDDGRTVHLTSEGLAKVEALLGIDLYAADQMDSLTAVNLALHAEALLVRDVDYIVRDEKVELIDEFRGRVAQRRRWPDGLQAAVEAKEKIRSSGGGTVLQTITVQAFLTQYKKICGMTGTALPVGDQLREFYKLEVAVIPPHLPNIRKDWPDRVYASAEERDIAVVNEIVAMHATGRPVLVGTLSVAESEQLAATLAEEGVECVVLNAKNDEKEAGIVAEAGSFNAVTVSTQMTGRGVDIRLGGSDEKDRERVEGLGGLFVIGTARNDSRRIDDQLRGRAGRQGDPGESMFFVSLEDELIQRYGPEPMPMGRADADGAIDDEDVRWAIGSAQRVAETVNLEIHRNTWRYNYLLDQHRQLHAKRREELLVTDAAGELLAERAPDRYNELSEELGEEVVLRIARTIALFHADSAWSEHLADMSELREGIHLRVLGAQDPLDEFHREAIPAFRGLLAEIDDRVVKEFEELEIDGPDWEPADAGLVRPSATWTYVVSDNPFGSEMERFFAGMVKLFRSGKGIKKG